MSPSDNFVYSKRDLVVAGVAIGIVTTLLGLGFGLASGASLPGEAVVLVDPPNNAYEAAVEILKEFPIVDGHNDFPLTIREMFNNDLEGWNFNSNLSQLALFQDYPSDHTDLPRLRKGQVGGQFWSAYMDCDTQYKDATPLFMEQIDVIKRLVDKYSDDMSFVTTSQGLQSAFKEGKIASMIGVESGHAISNSLGVLRLFHEMGVRYMTLTHSCNTPWADSSEAESGNQAVNSRGLSAFGEIIVREMNRLGMMVDISHVSADTMRDVLALSKAPIIFSHSSARSVNNVSRNVPDDVLEQVAINGGVVMVNFYDCFVIPDCNRNRATVQDVVNHINHIRKIAGVDHVGIGADFNGVSQTPNGLEDVSKYPNLFAALLEDKDTLWSKEDLGKLASGNLLRVWQEVEHVSSAIKASGELPHQRLIPVEDLSDTSCISKSGLARN